MSGAAAVIGWVLHNSDLLAPHGWTRRRTNVVLLAAACLSAALFAVAYPAGLDWLGSL